MSTVMQIQIENLKCGGCEKSILKGLSNLQEISDVKVDHESNTFTFTGNLASRDTVTKKLRSMGYPEKDSLSGLEAGLANAKSFVSCAIGRVS